MLLGGAGGNARLGDILPLVMGAMGGENVVSLDQQLAGLLGRDEPRGLSEAAFDRLQLVHWQPSMKDRNQTFESCPICYIDYEEGNEMKVLSCQHGYHTSCLQNWLKKNATCPICKSQIDS